jgi:monoamine oxidase
LEGHNGAGIVAGPVAKEAIIQAYTAEYGLEADEQSCLNFLLFIHADKRSKFTPFGVFSDERYHVIGGNDRIVQGLAGELGDQIHLDMRLVKVHKTSAGRIELTFKHGASARVRTHDAVVLAIPFTLLREVELATSLGLPVEKRLAIDVLGYGTNAKMMVGYSSRPWYVLGSNGASYSDLANHQATWETNPIDGADTRGILTDYSSGTRGANLNPKDVQAAASRFLEDLHQVYPGASAAATVRNGKYIAFFEHWPSNPLAKGSYTCYTPGQFTTIAGHEGTPVGNLHFAGEHANSFDIWQGFMEGACLSGIDAAHEILQDVKAG